jgi:BlaI family transcriptional regulator, penicillinase repressor
MARHTETLGPLELEVLQYVVDHQPSTVREVAAHFASSSGQARTTVLTVMERLRAKRYLTRRKVEGRHQYTPTVVKAELLHGMVADFVNDVLGGNVSPFVAYLARSSRLNNDEVRKLEQLLKRVESREERDRP